MNRYPGRWERSWWTLKTRQLRLEIIEVLLDAQRPAVFEVIFSGRVSRGRDLRRPVVDSVADETLAA